MKSWQYDTGVPVVFFDGRCNLCNRSVLFIIRNEKDGILHFASLESGFARQTLKYDPQSDGAYTTLILLEDGEEYHRSDGAIRISRYLRSPWDLLWYARYVPRRLRDAVYNFVARHRYAVFGKRETCLEPTLELRSRFLDV
jgi:predicted DCC family thiol-disulfide oxidoreductase YuxK